MKLYRGTRIRGRCSVVVETGAVERVFYDLDPRFDLVNHSPDGFEWNYRGSGPSQLALALCADATGDDAVALRCYLNLTHTLVARLPKGDWDLPQQEILDRVALIERILHGPNTLTGGQSFG